MNVGELIEKLQQVPPSTAICVRGEMDIESNVEAYALSMNVERWPSGYVYVQQDNGRDSIETVVLLSQYGEDDLGVRRL